MRPYGLPRNDDVEWPDKTDGLYYGLKGFHIKSAKKTLSRRFWAKAERQRGKREIKAEVESLD